MVEVSGVMQQLGTVVVVGGRGEAVVVVTPASPALPPRRKSAGSWVREKMVSPGLQRRGSLALLKQPVVTALLGVRRSRARSLSKVSHEVLMLM
ncbi:hypothetical protein Pcinc_042479 [Petrolisthes cinctipes]|uniref:Uncharacterized protein n=1 Tax=Petrolisthes cinctipes TaxID=88211 RepID=A0AAE1BIC9_PETCI|nr:hypothetical protein Pcinc_042479 [Petrolisthes cinctipes]